MLWALVVCAAAAVANSNRGADANVTVPPASCNPKLPKQLCPGGAECPDCGKAVSLLF